MSKKRGKKKKTRLSRILKVESYDDGIFVL